MNIREIAEAVHGEVIGNGDVDISGAAGLSDAASGDITFLVSAKHAKALLSTPATAVLVGSPLTDCAIPQIVVKNPQYAFAQLLERFYPQVKPKAGVSAQASVDETAQIGTETAIAPFVCIESGVRIGSRCVLYPGVYVGRDTVIGDDCILYPNVTVRERLVIGSRVIIHAGAVVGADGFGYVYADGQHRKIPQVGTVVIEDDVEIGALAAIDRATTGKTVVGAGTKIDNLVQIGHNVVIGRQAIIVSQVGLGGSTRIGDGVMIGGQAGIADHADIAAGSMLAAGTGVMPGTLAKGVYAGVPAMPHRDWLRSLAITAQLPELKKRIQQLEARLAEMTKKEEA
ncbi:MAG TPA: UDP-3-O-(3-hydroxymyristoyl)glucosamine N-acyltransferase [Dissulfurispiraceae bacterium]|nr:UDP-3-O-(3-hydroxymyristoyl)glucosamine N-acyltransferase [Dissulfurispiraceae bacterium]